MVEALAWISVRAAARGTLGSRARYRDLSDTRGSDTSFSFEVSCCERRSCSSNDCNLALDRDAIPDSDPVADPLNPRVVRNNPC